MAKFYTSFAKPLTVVRRCGLPIPACLRPAHSHIKLAQYLLCSQYECKLQIIKYEYIYYNIKSSKQENILTIKKSRKILRLKYWQRAIVSER